MSELVKGFDLSIVEQKALKVGPAGIDIAYQRLGKPDAPLVLLIMGVAAQSIHWPDTFCHALVEQRPASHPFRQSGLRALHAPDGCPVSGLARGARRRPVVGVVHAVGYGGRRGRVAGRARIREGTRGGRVHGRADCANDGDRASGPGPLAHFDDVDNGQHVGGADPRRTFSAKCSAGPANHSRRSDSADAPGSSAPSARLDIRATRRKSPRGQAAPTTAATIRSA